MALGQPRDYLQRHDEELEGTLIHIELLETEHAGAVDRYALGLTPKNNGTLSADTCQQGPR